jgi:hypothetical protein
MVLSIVVGGLFRLIGEEEVGRVVLIGVGARYNCWVELRIEVSLAVLWWDFDGMVVRERPPERHAIGSLSASASSEQAWAPMAFLECKLLSNNTTSIVQWCGKD